MLKLWRFFKVVVLLQQLRVSPYTRWAFFIVGIVLGLYATWQQVNKTDFPIDMIIYREGVQAFLDGRSLYSEPMKAGDLPLPFIYPPFGAFVMIPLSIFGWMDADMAGNIMIILSNALIFFCLYFVLRSAMGTTPIATAAGVDNVGPELVKKNIWWITAVVWGIVVYFEPVDLNNGFAQINIVLMALVVFDLVPRKRWLPQGTLIGIAAAIKITPAAMLLYFLLRKEWKPIATAAFSAVIATAIAAIFRWQAFVEFFSVKLLAMGTGKDIGVGTDYQSNSSIKGVIQRLFTSREVMLDNGTVINVVWLVATAITVWLGSRVILAMLRRGFVVDAQLTTAIVMLLISPVSWSHHWIWLTLIVPVFFYRAWAWRRVHWIAGSFIALMTCWSYFLMTVPPKWWFGDIINVQEMPFYQKILVNDFVWLAILSLAMYVFLLKRSGEKRNNPCSYSNEA